MRRVAVVVVLVLAGSLWPAASAVAHGAATQAAPAGSLQADFNNDGADDLAVGVPFETVGSIGQAGAVNVLYGSPTGLSGTGSQLFTQDTPGIPDSPWWGDRFGSALAAGDFNGDSFADLAVGAPGEWVNGDQSAGVVHVLYGSATGLSGIGSQLFTQEGSNVEYGDDFGDALVAGDFNHDNFADLAAGAHWEDVGSTPNAGAVSVLYGSATGLSGIGSQLFTQVGSAVEADDWFGDALAAGDFNHDNFTDLAAGAPYEDVGSTVDAGAVSVLYGSAGGLTAVGGRLFPQVAGTAEAGDGFGWALAAGDFNHDNFTDLAAGAPYEDVGSTVDAGAVSVAPGSAGGLTAVGGQLFTQVAGVIEAGDGFGYALAAGDFNHDNFADLAAGALWEHVGCCGDAGAVSVAPGSAGGLTAVGGQLFTQDTPGVPDSVEAYDSFGITLAAGDPSPSAASASP